MENGHVNGKPASEVLDMLIIPGGSLVESGSIGSSLSREIIRMAETGKLVLGVCAGFQVLARRTDVGRLSPTPIFRHGLGLIDAEFSPLVCTDRVTATVVGKSFLANEVGLRVKGFHCHTYGKITLKEEARPILVSNVRRLNYRSNSREIISGASNMDGNVVGVLLHAMLDENPAIIEGIRNSLGASHEELEAIREANAALRAKLKGELGVSTGISISLGNQKTPLSSCLLFTATGSGAGKTFIITGVAGALKRGGVNVGVLKVGGDIRDIVPAFYLIKEPVKPYSSIKIGESGWKPVEEAISMAGVEYSLLVIEGAMGDLTGLLNEGVEHPASTAEVALIMNIPVVLIVGCDKAGIEGALADAVSHIKLLRKLGVNVAGVILNKLKLSYMSDEVKRLIDQTFRAQEVALLGIIPRMEMEERGMIPEVEIRYEEFCARALEAAEHYINVKELLRLARPPRRNAVDLKSLNARFKELLTRGVTC